MTMNNILVTLALLAATASAGELKVEVYDGPKEVSLFCVLYLLHKLMLVFVSIIHVVDINSGTNPCIFTLQLQPNNFQSKQNNNQV